MNNQGSEEDISSTGRRPATATATQEPLLYWVYHAQPSDHPSFRFSLPSCLPFLAPTTEYSRLDHYARALRAPRPATTTHGTTIVPVHSLDPSNVSILFFFVIFSFSSPFPLLCPSPSPSPCPHSSSSSFSPWTLSPNLRCRPRRAPMAVMPPSTTSTTTTPT